MKVLIVGSGGREHALAWKAAQSPRVREVFVAPGNAGTAREPKVCNIPLGPADIQSLAGFARDHGVGLTVVGPELPLVAGINDLFRARGLRCFGPLRAAARLEGSKVFAKEFMARHGIPTAASGSFAAVEDALAFAHAQALPLVIKADGLAAGKGVVIAEDWDQAETAIRGMLSGASFGEAGRRILVEEYLSGEEASFIVMVDGERVLPFAGSQDHKARDDGDRGPNTGGMGAYSPAPVLTEEMQKRVLSSVILPTVQGMKAEGHPYTGFLYAGLMIGADGVPRVLEFNCRLGDPEAQPLLMRLRSDLVDLCEAGVDGGLDEVQADWDARTALGVVMAARGYPGPYRKGDPIAGLPERDSPDTKVFHAGTAEKDGQVVTDGGRVLCAVALGSGIAEAQARAYETVRGIHWEGAYYRKDIGHRAMARAARSP
jgi:phosphoribosylamine---glycine ligase